jgi:hypothetical protein
MMQHRISTTSRRTADLLQAYDTNIIGEWFLKSLNALRNKKDEKTISQGHGSKAAGTSKFKSRGDLARS